MNEIQYSQDLKRAYWSNANFEVSAIKFPDSPLAHIFIKQKGRVSRFTYRSARMPKIPKYLNNVCLEIKEQLEA
ncbi:hypothetical protein [Schinkia azotoformans]|uniref:hypothetical protein n=1 Tax=Schinkia azotoformans TaxID=1454 RepID=UPI002DB950A1|nr:hypothetical protein [Schinkia azotoformans]MEC1778427.1 hypothetical protein [Schinkia azotoformans]MED4328328.1 hypothetical protein [Schinkia azotoformans]